MKALSSQKEQHELSISKEYETEVVALALPLEQGEGAPALFFAASIT